MALKHAIIYLLLAVACSTFQEGEGLDYLQDEEFQEWVSHFHQNGENLAQIYPTWRRNADFVRHQNTLGLSYTLSVNKFAHLDINDLVRGKNRKTTPLESVSQDLAPHDIPSSVDWREKGIIPPVASQGQCGDPVLFAAVDSIDAIWAINSPCDGQLILGSREECMDCCLKNNGCHGEVYGPSIYECVVRLGGLAREDDYVSPNHTCLSDKFSPAVKISGAKYLTPSGDEQALAVAVARQPIVVAVDASHQSFQLYESGIYYEPDCSSEISKLDHAVLVVGYGSKGGQDYWIVKNSWGESWGMNGYVLMARNKNNNCGIATEAMYPY